MTTSPSVLLSLKSSNIQWHHHFLIFSIEIVIWGYPIFRQNRTEQGTRPSPILPTLQKMRRPDHPTTRQPVPSCELHTTLLAAGGLPCTGASTSFTCREGASKILEDWDIGLMGPRIFFRCIYFFFLLLYTVYIYVCIYYDYSILCLENEGRQTDEESASQREGCTGATHSDPQ